MRTVTVDESVAVASLGAAALQGCHDVAAESFRAELGHDDFAEPPEELRAELADQRHEAKILLLGLADPAGVAVTSSPAPAGPDAAGRPADVLGYAIVQLPRTDNQHLAAVDLLVRPSARRQGVGTALWRAAEHQARAAGRTTVTTWALHGAEPPPGPGALTAPTGAGRIPARHPSTRFALAHGFTLEQAERQSTLHLPVPPESLAAWRAEAEAHAGADYRLVQWLDDTPAQWLDAIAALRRSMSTDVPAAGLDFREEEWDADRVRDADERLRARGGRSVLSAALHVPTGELVAYTQLERRGEEVVFQQDTLVRADHRGRRLGLLVKAANVELLAETFPGARRLHTWNAEENRHMLAINERMGFVAASVEGAWQLRLGG